MESRTFAMAEGTAVYQTRPIGSTQEAAMSLQGSRFVITGGGTGIGFATAKLAAARGASVVLMGRRESKLAGAVETIGRAASYRVLDVTDGEAVVRVFKELGRFDHLVTCAAGIAIGPFTELPESALRDFFEVKFWGQVRAIRAALPTLARDGSIVAVSGFLYRKPSAGYSPFAAVNGAIEALVKVLAIELAPVRVNALVPGQIDTLRDIIGEQANRGRVEAAAAKLPVGRIGSPEDVAHAALFLAENGFTTGATLDVDGGER
jgi:NAD(P)-dependent dehydrogenase (short-subunit alcohol dehydrogenase family)